MPYLPVLAVILACVALVAPSLLFGEAYYLKDAQTWFYPSRLALRERLLGGDLPLWLPQLRLGMQFLADPGNGVLYPLNALLLLPAPQCVGRFLGVHVVLAGAGTYALLRALRLRPEPAVLGACAYALSGYVLSMTWSGVYLLSISWMPAVAAAALGAMRTSEISRVAWFALALGCQLLTGEMQGVSLTAALVLGLLAAEGRPFAPAIGRVAGGAALALLLAAPQILPTLDFLSATSRAGGFSLEVADQGAIHPLEILGVLASGVFGDPVRFDEYTAFSLGGTARPALPWTASAYCGSIAIVLALLALLQARRRPAWVWVVGALAALALLLSLGSATPLFAWYQALVPGADLLRIPAKFFPLAAMGVSVLAARGLDTMISEPWRRRLPPAWAALFGGLLGALVVGALASDAIARAAGLLAAGHGGDHAARVMSSALRIEAGWLLAFVLSVLLLRRRHREKLGAAIAALLIVQLAVMNRDVAPTTSPALYERVSPVLEKVKSGYGPGEPARMIHAAANPPQAAACLNTPSFEELAVWEAYGAEMNIGVIAGVSYAGAYSSLEDRSRNRFWRASTGDVKNEMDLVSARYLVVGADRASRVERQGLRRVEGLPHDCLRLYETADALPYARVSSSVRLVGTADEAIAIAWSAAAARGEVAAVEVDPAELAPPGAPAESSGRGACRGVRHSGDEISMRCAADARTWVVINESFAPGWEATVDGRRGAVRRANGAVIAVRMPPGDHALRLVYRERHLLLGAAFAGAGLLACAALFGLSVRRRRRADI